MNDRASFSFETSSDTQALVNAEEFVCNLFKIIDILLWRFEKLWRGFWIIYSKICKCTRSLLNLSFNCLLIITPCYVEGLQCCVIWIQKRKWLMCRKVADAKCKCYAQVSAQILLLFVVIIFNVFLQEVFLNLKHDDKPVSCIRKDDQKHQDSCHSTHSCFQFLLSFIKFPLYSLIKLIEFFKAGTLRWALLYFCFKHLY